MIKLAIIVFVGVVGMQVVEGRIKSLGHKIFNKHNISEKAHSVVTDLNNKLKIRQKEKEEI